MYLEGDGSLDLARFEIGADHKFPTIFRSIPSFNPNFVRCLTYLIPCRRHGCERTQTPDSKSYIKKLQPLYCHLHQAPPIKMILSFQTTAAPPRHATGKDTPLDQDCVSGSKISIELKTPESLDPPIA